MMVINMLSTIPSALIFCTIGNPYKSWNDNWISKRNQLRFSLVFETNGETMKFIWGMNAGKNPMKSQPISKKKFEYDMDTRWENNGKKNPRLWRGQKKLLSFYSRRSVNIWSLIRSPILWLFTGFWKSFW